MSSFHISLIASSVAVWLLCVGMSVSSYPESMKYNTVAGIGASEVQSIEGDAEIFFEKAQTDPNAALEDLASAVRANSNLMGRCHGLAHEIGHRAYGTLREQALALGNAMCGAGYLHGVIEEAVAKNGVSELNGRVHELCGGEKTESCLHGLGHALFGVTGNVRDATDLCARIETNQTDCYDGVFMEVFDDESSTTKKRITFGEATGLCSESTSAAQPSCYFYLPRVQKHAPTASTTSSCSFLGGEGQRAACAQGSGVMFMKYEPVFDDTVASSHCADFSDKIMKDLCLKGVADYFAYGNIDNMDW